MAPLIQFNVRALDATTGELVTAPLVVRIDAGLSGTVRNGNPSNFYNGPPLAMPWVGDVEVIAAGYAPWTTGASPQITFDDSTVEVVARLQPTFKRPLTREERLAVRGGFCSHPVTLNGYGTIPCFDPFTASLDAANRQIVYATKRALGLNAIVLSANYSYDYPVPGHDWRGELGALKSIVQEAISAGLIPIFTLTNGGQGDWHYWFDNDGANYRDGVAVFKRSPDLTRYLVSAILWEVIGPGGDWTPDQVGTAQLIQRSAWGEDVNAVCAIEYGSGYAKAFLSGHEDGRADWNTPAGMAVDLFLYEAQQPVLDPSSMDRNYDCTAALLGPAANVPPPPPPNHRPGWYLRDDCPRGRRVACVFEDRAYAYIRGGISLEESAAITAFERSIGWTVFGNVGSAVELR